MVKKILLTAAIFLSVASNIYCEDVSDLIEGDSFIKKEDPFLYYEVYDDGELVGYTFNTRDVAPEEKGGSGPIEILVAIDRGGNILNLKILQHNETPEYAAGIVLPEFLDQFKGKGPEDGFIVGEDIDGITRATVSSTAVSKTLKVSLERMKGVIRAAQKKTNKIGLRLGIDFYLTVFIISFILIGFYFKKTFLRYAGLLFSLVYFGFIKANFLSISGIWNIVFGNFPNFTSNLPWFIFISSALVLTFVLGGFYCSSMCPFGALQVFLGKIFRFKLEISNDLSKNLRRIRYLLLWTLSIIVLLLHNPHVVLYEPSSTVFLRRGNVVAWSIAVIILILSMVHFRPFCNYFCATGAFLGIVSKLGRKVFKRR